MTLVKGLLMVRNSYFFFFHLLCLHDFLTHSHSGTEKIRGELRQVAIDVDDQKRSSSHSYLVIENKA